MPPVSQRRSHINDRGFFHFIGDFLDAIACLSAETLNKALTPFDFDQKLNLFKQSLSSPAVEAQVSIDLEAKTHADVTIGVAASGITPPAVISELAFITSMNADLDGNGVVDSGKIELYEVGIPGLDFPGVLTFGPSFRIDAQAKATLTTGVGMSTASVIMLLKCSWCSRLTKRPPLVESSKSVILVRLDHNLQSSHPL